MNALVSLYEVLCSGFSEREQGRKKRITSAIISLDGPGFIGLLEGYLLDWVAYPKSEGCSGK
jgi:hypothetical protein